MTNIKTVLWVRPGQRGASGRIDLDQDLLRRRIRRTNGEMVGQTSRLANGRVGWTRDRWRWRVSRRPTAVERVGNSSFITGVDRVQRPPNVAFLAPLVFSKSSQT